METAAEAATMEAFERLELRCGTVVGAEPFPEARVPAIRLSIDLGGDLGIRRSSARLTRHYSPDRLIGRQVVVVANLPPRRVAGFDSEVLTLGLPDENGEPVLLRPDFAVPDGGRVY